jgi:hypothetical protein
MHLLYYWRGNNYRRDLDHGVGFHLNQANRLLHQIDIGESLWAFTRPDECLRSEPVPLSQGSFGAKISASNDLSHRGMPAYVH